MGSFDSTSSDRVMNAFDGEISPVSVPATYRVGLALVALAMVLLPLVYLGIIVGVGWLLWLHVENAPALFSESGSMKGRVVLFVAPLVIGGTLLLFLIKPLFAKRVKQQDPMVLDPANEPLLFAFVHKIAETVGAPRPTQIRVDCQVNASAGFRRGFLSMLGNDLVLTIGMPLVTGLTLRQLAGVLAHEFGHFAQGTGMRLTYVIRSVNAWFARVVYERDAWDERLERWSKDNDFRIMILLYITRFFVWLSRKILWALMNVGHRISSFMLRQMEFDADRYEARVSGSRTFESTAIRLHELNVASNQAYELLGQSWQNGRLVADLPRLVETGVQKLNPEVRASIEEHIRTAETGTFDTHPTDRERIASAHREDAQGIFRLESPADILFADSDAVSREATRHYYREVLGEAAENASIDSNEALAKEDAEVRAARESALRFLGGSFTMLRPPAIVPWDGDTPDADALRDARDAMQELLPAAQQAMAVLDRADDRRRDAVQAGALLEAGFTINAGDFGLQQATIDDANRVAGEAASECAIHAETIDRFNRAGGRRLAAALALVSGDDPDPAPWVSTLEALRSGFEAHDQLRIAYGAIAILGENLENSSDGARVIREMTGRAKAVVELLKRMAGALDTRYPFPHADDAITLARYTVGDEVIAASDLNGVFRQCQRVFDCYGDTWFRTLGCLTRIAEQVEQRLGIEPLPPQPQPENAGE